MEWLKDPPVCLAPDVSGFTTAKVRMLLNRLVAALPSEEAHFEVGCFRGATLISALLDHHDVTSYACDDFSGTAAWPNTKQIFESNLQKYKDRLPSIKFYEESCWNLPKKKPFQKPIGIFFYDGDHSYESQRRAIVEFAPFLASQVIILVDDWNWQQVREGTFQGLCQMRPMKMSYFELPGNEDMPWTISSAIVPHSIPNYSNGIGAFHLHLQTYMADVTDRLKAEIKGDKLKIKVVNEIFGDPAIGLAKELRVHYLDGNETKWISVRENMTLDISASPGRWLAVKKAVYGDPVRGKLDQQFTQVSR